MMIHGHKIMNQNAPGILSRLNIGTKVKSQRD